MTVPPPSLRSHLAPLSIVDHIYYRDSDLVPSRHAAHLIGPTCQAVVSLHLERLDRFVVTRGRVQVSSSMVRIATFRLSPAQIYSVPRIVRVTSSIRSASLTLLLHTFLTSAIDTFHDNHRVIGTSFSITLIGLAITGYAN